MVLLLIALAIMGYCGVFKCMRRRYSKRHISPSVDKVPGAFQESETASLLSDKDERRKEQLYRPLSQARETSPVQSPELREGVFGAVTYARKNVHDNLDSLKSAQTAASEMSNDAANFARMARALERSI